jgi:hypothetical protein
MQTKKRETGTLGNTEALDGLADLCQGEDHILIFAVGP